LGAKTQTYVNDHIPFYGQPRKLTNFL